MAITARHVMKSRRTLEECVAQHLLPAYLNIRREGYIDIEATAEAMKEWVDKMLTEEGLEKRPSAGPSMSEGVRMADHCSRLKQAIMKQIADAETAVNRINFKIKSLQEIQQHLNSSRSKVVPPVLELTQNPSAELSDSGIPEVVLHDGIEAILVNPISKVHQADVINIKRKAGQDRRSTMISFIEELGSKDSPTHYQPTQCKQMLLKLLAMLHDAVLKIDPDSDWVQKSQPAPGQDPDVAAQETIERITAAFIYSVDGKDCNCGSVEECRANQLEDAIAGENAKHQKKPKTPENTKVFGHDGSHWAIMNWTLRVAADGTSQNFNEAEQAMLKSAIGFFAPFADRLRQALQILPREPRVVFRGVNIPLASKYKLGSEVVFPPFTSTSLEAEEAMKFMGTGGTYFVLSTRGGGLIADFSHYPEQAEALLRTNTRFVVTSKMSRTLLQLLGNDFDVVFMHEVLPTGLKEPGANAQLDFASNHGVDDRDDIPVDEAIKLLIGGARTAEFVYSGYKKRYIEGRLSLTRPASELIDGETVAASAKIIPLYKATDHFVEISASRHMMLLGNGGAGKTSALVACLCHLMNKKDRSTRPLLPVFVSLPSVGQRLHEVGGLDAHVRNQLRLSVPAFTKLRSVARVVLLLDSLDEVAPNRKGQSIVEAKILDPQHNPWSFGCKTIVSCRTEAIDGAGLTDFPSDSVITDLNSSFSVRAAPLVYHVWPFNSDDRVQFMENVAAERIRELAKNEADKQFAQLSEMYQLNDDELQQPCVLTIATEVVSASDGHEVTKVMNKYMLYERFVVMALKSYHPSIQEAITRGLERLALRMMKEHRWQLPVAEVTEELSSVLKYLPPAIAPQAKIETIIGLLPSRCEDLHNPEALWGFWHKTVTEFLVARWIGRLPPENSASGKDDWFEATALLESQPGIKHFAELYRWRVGKQRNLPPGTTADSPVLARWFGTLTDKIRSPSLRVVDCRGIPLPNGATLEDMQLQNVLHLVVPITRLTATPEGDPYSLLWPSVEYLDLSQAFPLVETIGEGFLSNSNVKRAILPQFPKIRKIPAGFLARCRIKHVTMTNAFPNVTVVGNDFGRDAASSRMELPTWPAIERVGENFLSGTKKLKVVQLPEFKHLISIPDDFMRGCGVRSLEMAHCFPNITSVGDNFCFEAHCGRMTLPKWETVSSFGKNFLKGTKLGQFDLASVRSCRDYDNPTSPVALLNETSSGLQETTSALQFRSDSAMLM